MFSWRAITMSGVTLALCAASVGVATTVDAVDPFRDDPQVETWGLHTSREDSPTKTQLERLLPDPAAVEGDDVAMSTGPIGALDVDPQRSTSIDLSAIDQSPSVPASAAVSAVQTALATQPSSSTLAAGNGTSPHSSPFQQPIGQYTGGAGCSIQCIKSGFAYQEGPGARIEVETYSLARIWIVVWNEDTGYYRVEESGPGSALTSFEAVFDDVELETTYQAQAIAVDGDGFLSGAEGTFVTGARHLEVHFDDIVLLEVPDEQATAVEVGIRINGEFEGDNAWTLGVEPIDHADRFVDIELWLFISHPGDCSASGGINDETPLYGSTDCSTWAAVTTGESPVDLDDRPANASAAAHSLHVPMQAEGGGALPGDYGQALSFTSGVTLEVSYG